MSIGVVVGSQYRITYLFDCHRKMIFSDIRSCMGRSGLPRVPEFNLERGMAMAGETVTVDAEL